MRRFWCSALLAAMAILPAASARAHFIFVVPEPAERPQTVKVYFGERAEPDDPELIKHIAAAKAWIINGRGEATPLELKVDGDALTGEIPEGGNRGSIVVQHDYGLLKHGENAFLLKYYAKAYTGSLPGSWARVNRNEELPLEIVPELSGKDLVCKVYWKGEPAAGSQVTIESPVLSQPLQGDTDESGVYKATLPQAGLYSIRARLTEDKPGQIDGKDYSSVRHYSTLALNYSPVKATAVQQSWPDLQKGMTSFGAAVAGDFLYVYGGNYGGAHQFSEANQSGDFIRLNLKDGKSWETLPGGPKLTGLAMDAHDGKIYRVGGFTVTDVKGGDAKLDSTTSFARFDPAVGKWEELTPLPEVRSSHDIAIIGDTLYVVGGWAMQSADTDNHEGWLKTAYACDLSADKLTWTKLPEVPFERRALSAAGHQGKLVVVGGMQSTDDITAATALYDPETKTWSEGPNILGDGMDGFGTAATDVDGRLIVTSMSGAVQQLSADGTHWELVGQLQHPRFFHETAPWQQGLVIVGGASMRTGKTNALELIRFDADLPDAPRSAQTR